MSLTVSYSNTHGSSLRPGSLVKGTVDYSSSKDESLSKVTVTLSGRCKVKIREHSHYTTRTFRSRGYFFHEQQLLFDGGGFTHKAGERSFPFTFTIPTFAKPHHEVTAPIPKRPARYLDHNGMMKTQDPSEHRHDEFSPQSPWRASKDLREHPLPDTMRVHHSKWPIDFEAKVEYAFIAKAERPARGSLLFSRSQDLEIVEQLSVKAAADTSAYKLLRSRHLKIFGSDVPAPLTRTPSTVGKVWSKVARQGNELTAIPCHFKVEIAKAVSTQSTIPFVVTASSSGTDSSPQRISIVDLTVTLVSKTSVRDDSKAAIEHTAIDVEKTVMCWRREQEYIDFTSHGPSTTTFQAKLEDLVHTPAVVPSFSTYNIAREYSIEYKIKVRVDRDEVFLNDSAVPLVILPIGSDVPPETDEGEQSAGAPAITKEEYARREANGIDPPPEEQLPAYQE